MTHQGVATPPGRPADVSDTRRAPRNGPIHASCGGCTARWPVDASAVTHCAGCHRSFMSVTGFDDHRTGPTDSRRCLTLAELAAAGFAPNDLGRWRIPRDADTLPGLAGTP